jgi:hypothetical protein
MVTKKKKNKNVKVPVVRRHTSSQQLARQVGLPSVPMALLSAQNQEDSKPVKIKYVLPPELVAHYADNLNVTHTETEFVLSFIQMQHPLLVTNDEWADVDVVEGKCVSRIIISPQKMGLFIQALRQNFERYIREAQESLEARARAESEGK